MLRVLAVSPRIFREGFAGGGERYPTELNRALRGLPEIEVHSISGESLSGFSYYGPSGEVRAPVGVRQARSLVLKADIVHVHQLNSVIGDFALAVTARVGPPLVLTDHGGGWRTPGRLLGHHRLRRFKGLAAVSRISSEDLQWPSRRPYCVLYGGGDHLAAARTTSREYDFVYAGRIIPHKGVMELLRSLPDGASCLVLGAPLHREYTADVLETGRRAGVTIDLGPTDADLAAGLRSAQWCVCPTQAALGGKELRHPELLGLTAIEAYLAGTRAVLSDVPAFAELAPLLGAVLYSSHEHRALAKQLMACISSPSEWTAMEPPEFFTWHSVAERARDFFQMILGSGGSEGKGLLA